MSSLYGQQPAQFPPPRPPRTKTKAGLSTWIVGAVAVLCVILGAVSGGVSGALIFLALFIFFSGLYTLVFGRPSWLRLPGRKWGGVAVGAGFILLIVGGLLAAPAPEVEETVVADDTQSSAPAATESMDPSPSSTPEPSETSYPNPEPTPSAAAEPVETNEGAVEAPEVPNQVPADSFTSCSEAAAAGVFNIPTDSPVFSERFDPDGDGVGCENSDVPYDPSLVAPQDRVPAVPEPAESAPVEPAPVEPAPVEPAAPQYRNCTEVKAAGAAPIREGDPGWQPKFDGIDNDGIGCEL